MRGIRGWIVTSGVKLGLLAILSFGSLLLLKAEGTGDVSIWLRWMGLSRELGLAEGYREAGADYPPGAQTALWLSGWLTSADVLNTVKILLLVALALTAAILASWARDLNAASLVVAAFALSAVGLGYLDILWAPALALSLWMFQEDRLLLGGLFFGAAVMTKWQPLTIAPLIILFLVQPGTPLDLRSVFRRLAPAIGGTAIVVSIVTVLVGPVPLTLSLARAFAHKFLSGNALNAPWIVGSFSDAQTTGISELVWLSQSDVPMVFPLLLRLLFLAATVIIYWRYWKSQRNFQDLIFASIMASLAYVALNVGVHENHLFLPCSLAVIGLSLVKVQRTALVTVIAMAQVNLIAFYGFSGTRTVSRTILGVDLSLPLAVMFVLMTVVACLGLESAMTRRSPQSQCAEAVAE